MDKFEAIKHRVEKQIGSKIDEMIQADAKRKAENRRKYQRARYGFKKVQKQRQEAARKAELLDSYNAKFAESYELPMYITPIKKPLKKNVCKVRRFSLTSDEIQKREELRAALIAKKVNEILDSKAKAKEIQAKSEVPKSKPKPVRKPTTRKKKLTPEEIQEIVKNIQQQARDFGWNV